MLLLCGILFFDAMIFHDADDRSVTGHTPSFDGVVLITGKNVRYVAGDFLHLGRYIALGDSGICHLVFTFLI